MESAKDGGRRFIVRPVSVIATGLAAAGAAFLTSRFGIAGTVLGTAVMTMLITAGASIIEIYLETAAAKARTVPSSLRVRVEPGNVSPREADTPHRAPGGFFARFASLPAARRRSVLAGTFVAAVLSFLIAMGAVTGVELSVGKSLSCWLWDECPERSSDGRPSSEAKTQPSVLGGQRITDSAQGVDHAPQEQPTYHQPTPPDPSRSPQQRPGMAPNPDGGRPTDAPIKDTPPEDLDRARDSLVPPREHPRPAPENGSAFPDEVSPPESRD